MVCQVCSEIGDIQLTSSDVREKHASEVDCDQKRFGMRREISIHSHKAGTNGAGVPSGGEERHIEFSFCLCIL